MSIIECASSIKYPRTWFGRGEFVKIYLQFVGFFSVIHLFPWSGIVDENQQLSETFRVPDLKTGRMVRLITQLTPKEEEMFRNMVRRMNTLCKVKLYYEK